MPNSKGRIIRALASQWHPISSPFNAPELPCPNSTTSPNVWKTPGVIAGQQVERHVDSWREETGGSDRSSAKDLLDWLAGKGLITGFQREAIDAGVEGPLMLGPFRVFEQLAAGRLGNVYRAEHDQTGQPVALKVFPPSLKDDAERTARMRREVEASLQLQHANIVRTFRWGQEGDVSYLVLEDLEGETLLDRIEREGAIAYRDACALLRDAARGLAAMHALGMVHRDVRPANMWVGKDGVLKVMELGAVNAGETGRKAAGALITTNESVVGHSHYMAPEQMHDPANATHHADIYAFGCTLFHCIAGRTPFTEKNPVKLSMRHANDFPEPLDELVPGVPQQLTEIVDAMMAKELRNRYPSIEDTIWALEQHMGGDVGLPPEIEVREDFLAWLTEDEAEYDTGQEARTPAMLNFLNWLAGKN